MDHRQSLQELQNFFTSEKNAELILDLSTKNIYEKIKVNIDKNDSEFFEIFNVIASSVFKHEKNKYNGIPVRESLILINRIVVNEITRYVVDKHLDKLEEASVEVSIKKETKEAFTLTEPTEVTLEEQTEIHCIESLDKPFELSEFNCENVSCIQLLKLAIFPEIYNITKANNVIAIKDILVELKEGKYSKESLLTELHEKIKEKTKLDYLFHLDTTTDLVYISYDRYHNIENVRTIIDRIESLKDKVNHNCKETFNIDILRSTVLPILGFSSKVTPLENKNHYVSDSPMKLNINNRINLIVKINSDNSENFIQDLNIPLILDTTKENVIDLSENIKRFSDNTGICLKSIQMSIDNYIDRKFPVSLILKITRLKPCVNKY